MQMVNCKIEERTFSPKEDGRPDDESCWVITNTWEFTNTDLAYGFLYGKRAQAVSTIKNYSLWIQVS